MWDLSGVTLGGWGSLELACVLSGTCTPKPPSRSVSQSLSLGSLPGVGESSWGGDRLENSTRGFFFLKGQEVVSVIFQPTDACSNCPGPEPHLSIRFITWHMVALCVLLHI